MTWFKFYFLNKVFIFIIILLERQKDREGKKHPMVSFHELQHHPGLSWKPGKGAPQYLSLHLLPPSKHASKKQD